MCEDGTGHGNGCEDEDGNILLDEDGNVQEKVSWTDILGYTCADYDEKGWCDFDGTSMRPGNDADMRYYDDADTYKFGSMKFYYAGYYDFDQSQPKKTNSFFYWSEREGDGRKILLEKKELRRAPAKDRAPEKIHGRRGQNIP